VIDVGAFVYAFPLFVPAAEGGAQPGAFCLGVFESLC